MRGISAGAAERMGASQALAVCRRQPPAPQRHVAPRVSRCCKGRSRCGLPQGARPPAKTTLPKFLGVAASAYSSYAAHVWPAAATAAHTSRAPFSSFEYQILRVAT